MISWSSPPELSTQWPPTNIWWRFSVVLISPSLRVLLLGGAGGNLGKSRADDVQTFIQQSVGDGQRHEGADHVVVHARTKKDQATLASEREDLRGLGVGWHL